MEAPKNPHFQADLDSLLLAVGRHYNNKKDLKQVEKAFWLAENAHREQKRASGEPFFIHPIAVAKIIAEYGLDPDTISAALLHDVVEDAGVSSKEIEKEFNKNVAGLVEGLTKLARIPKDKVEDVEEMQRIFLATVKDVRVIIIKLIDKLHNMRTLQFLPESMRKDYARKCLELYAPIAHNLGIHEIKNELEDLSFQFIDAETFESMKKALVEKRKIKEKEMKEVMDKLKKDLVKNKIKAEMEIHPKAIKAIYNKMQHTNKTLDEIEDASVLVVIVNSVDDCYRVLGRVHQNFTPRPKKIKDFIAMPLKDLYQSIHTTIVSPHGKIIKVYIRTKEMDELRKKGIVHLLVERELKRKGQPHWIRDWAKDLRALLKGYRGKDEDFLDALKTDFLGESINVLTVKGDSIELPKGSTPLDFAYAVHTAVGNKCLKAKVNERIVPLWHELEAGDKVEIITNNQMQVKKEWLDFAKTQRAKKKISKTLKSIKEKIEAQYANVRLKLADKPGVLLKVTKIISKNNLNIASVHSVTEEYPHTCNLTLRFESEKQLEKAIKELNTSEEVIELKYHLI